MAHVIPEMKSSTHLRSVCQKYVSIKAARQCRYKAASSGDHTAKEDDGSCQLPCTPSFCQIFSTLSNLVGCDILFNTEHEKGEN